jgi:hypothetical protein
MKEGYVLVDHSASPGISKDMALKAGYDPRYASEGMKFEGAVIACRHCRAHVVKNPLRTRERAFCGKCNDYICDACHALSTLPNYSHKPYEQILDERLAGMGSPLELLSP